MKVALRILRPTNGGSYVGDFIFNSLPLAGRLEVDAHERREADTGLLDQHGLRITRADLDIGFRADHRRRYHLMAGDDDD